MENSSQQVLPPGQDVESCKAACLTRQDCVSFDSFLTGDVQSCYFNPSYWPLLDQDDSIHYEYRRTCTYCSFLYIGEYAVIAGSATSIPATDGEDCLQKCVASSSCQVASYLKNQCWHSPTEQTALSERTLITGWSQYLKVNCSHPPASTIIGYTITTIFLVRSTPACANGGTNQWISYANRYALDGIAQPSAQTLDNCRRLCLIISGCNAINFNSNAVSLKCWIFLNLQNPQLFVELGVVHEHLNKCYLPTTITPSSSTSDVTTTGRTPPPPPPPPPITTTITTTTTSTTTTDSPIEPVVDIFPDRGPQAGGTNLTVSIISGITEIHAVFLEFAAETSKECPIFMKYPGGIIAQTPIHNESVSSEVVLKITNNGKSRIWNTGYNFMYKPNPNIENIKPNKTLVGGGTKLTVSGSSLDAVASPKISYGVDECSADRTNFTITKSCQGVSSDTMFCLTPNVSVCQVQLEEDAKDDLPRQSAPDEAAFYLTIIGFVLDGDTDYVDLEKHPNLMNDIGVYEEPILHKPTKAIQYHRDVPLEIKGKHLDRGATIDDYEVYVGQETCLVLNQSLTDSKLLCFPPNPTPQKSNDSQSKYHRIKVKVGNYEYIYGEMWYPWWYNQVIVITVATAGAVLLFIIVMIIVIKVKKKRQKQKEDNNSVIFLPPVMRENQDEEMEGRFPA